MRYLRYSLAIGTAVAVAALAMPAQATTYLTRAAFNAAVSGVVDNDLDALPTGPITTVFGIDTISSSGPGAVISPYSGFGQALSGVSAFDSVKLTFSAPIYAFAFDDLDLTGNSEFANIRVTLAGGGVEDYSIFETDFDFTTGGFFGIWRSTAIQSVEVWSSNNIGDPPGGRANLIDNLAISRIAQQGGVPEPAAWAMMLAGFGLAGGALRRRTARGVATA